MIVSSNTFNSLRHFELMFGYCDYTLEGIPYYVGIGNVTRIRRLKRNKKHTNIANKHGQRRCIECIAIHSYDLLVAWEKQKITELQTFHYDNPEGIGSNFTTGGEGTPNFRHPFRIRSEIQRQKISQSKRMLYADPAERQKLGEAIRKAKSDPIKYENHCKAQQKRYADPAERQKAHESNSQKKRVHQLSLDGEFIAEFPSMSYAVKATGIKNIKVVCQGKRPLAGGFRWIYVD